MLISQGPPANGADGGDVILFCDPSLDSLNQFHQKDKWVAKNGANGNPEEGTQAPKKLRRTVKKASDLRIGVPPGGF